MQYSIPTPDDTDDRWKRASFQLDALQDFPAEFYDAEFGDISPCLGALSTERLNWLNDAFPALSPSGMFDALVAGKAIGDNIVVTGFPGEQLTDLQKGDYIIERVFGEGPLAQIHVIEDANMGEIHAGQRLPRNSLALRLNQCRCSNCRHRV